MNLPVTFFANFSPYHDPDPVSDFYEDTAQRITSVVALVFAVHIAIFFMLSTRFVMPDMIEEELEPIPVQIIAFEDLPAVPAPPPEITELRPAVPAPAPPPKIKPKPKPAPPPPPPTPEPEPKPEIAPPPPPPEILSQPIIEPEPDPLPAPAETPPPPEPEPIIQPEPVPQPIPVPPEPIVEPVIEPAPIIEMFEPLPEPVPEPEPEPIIEIFEPAPEIIEEPLPDVLPEPILEPEPYITQVPTELPPLPGPIIEETLPELPQLEDLPPLPTPEPETIVETPPALPAPEPEIIETPPDTEPAIITTAPTILASPDAPTTSEEAKTAVPQSQSDPFIDFIKKNPVGRGARQPATGRPAVRNPAIAGPSAGGGNINAPPTIGTKRGPSGPTNWTLTQRPSGEGLGEGYGGLVLDMRCREAQKTHLECPEYLRKFRGRNAAGWENFNGMAGRGTDRGTTTASHIAGGGTVGGGTSQLGRIGDNSVNGGGPSTSILDDPANSFDRTFPGKDFDYGQNDGRRLRDLLTPPEDEEPIELILTPPEE